MNTSLKDQIKAVQRARNSMSPENFGTSYDKLWVALNDAASSLAAINLILSGDVGQEFEIFLNTRKHVDTTMGQDLNAFLAQKGLKLK